MILDLRAPPDDRHPDGRVYDPLPGQAKFHANPSKYRAYIGGVGSGKTLSNCIEAFLTSQEYPGSLGVMARFTWTELKTTTWSTLKAIIPQEFLASPILESSHLMRIELLTPRPGRISTILGWNGGNWKNLTSLNLDWFGIDEVTEYPNEDVWGQLTSRLRGGVGPRRGWCTGTPAGQDWVWQRFVRKGYAGYAYVRAKTRENWHLPAGYEEDLRRTNSSEWVRRFLDAEFNVFEGMVFYPWDERYHVIDEFPIPSHWPRFYGIDPGLADPTAILIATTDENGNLFIVDEYYQTNKTIHEQADAFLGMWGHLKFEWGMIDSSAERRADDSGKKRIELYREAGLKNLQPATKRLLESISQVQEMMRLDPARKHIQTGQSGAPRLYVFRRCVNLRRELSIYRYGRNDKPVDKDNHTVDVLRYIVDRRPHAALRTMGRKRNEYWQEFQERRGQDRQGGHPLIGAGSGGTMRYSEA
jgi:phage terminase large subunit